MKDKRERRIRDEKKGAGEWLVRSRVAGKIEAPEICQGRLPLGTARRDLLWCRDGIGEDDLGQPILVLGIRVGNVGLGFLEGSLAEFDDGAETDVVAGLREGEGQARLIAQLPGGGKALIGSVGVPPGVSDVAGDVVWKVGGVLAIRLGLQICGFGPRVEEKTLKGGD